MRSRVTAAIAAVLMDMVLIATPAQAAPSAPLNIVAFGDSYASGAGAGSYEAGTNVEGGCWRSANSYSEQVVAQLRAAGKQVNFTNVTCSGATTFDIRQTQLGTLTANTTHVLLTAGGNNLEFAKYAGLCIVSDCSGAPSAVTDALIWPMVNDLSKLLGEIKQRAPQAQVIMVGYGRPVTKNASTPSTADPICGAFSTAERSTPGQIPANDANDVSTHLDFALLGTALARGVDYVSPFWVPGTLRPTFAGHSLCESKQQWYHGFDALAPGGDGNIAILHPTPAWQTAVSQLVASDLELIG